MTDIVPVEGLHSRQNYKREAYEMIFTKIVLIQETYHKLVRELIKSISSSIPASKQDVEKIIRAEEQVDILSAHIGKLEDLKYFSSLALLSEGGLITSEELGYAISSATEMINIAKIELESDESFIKNWAIQKIDLLEQIEEVMLQILDHKTKRKTKIGEIKIH